MSARSVTEQPSATEQPSTEPASTEQPNTEPSPVAVQQPPTDGIELTSVLAALSDPLRLDLVRELADCGVERTCGSFNLPIAKSTATHHWRVLREAGVIASREEGTKKYNRLRRDDLDERFPGLLDSILTGAESSAG